MTGIQIRSHDLIDVKFLLECGLNIYHVLADLWNTISHITPSDAGAVLV